MAHTNAYVDVFVVELRDKLKGLLLLQVKKDQIKSAISDICKEVLENPEEKPILLTQRKTNKTEAAVDKSTQTAQATQIDNENLAKWSCSQATQTDNEEIAKWSEKMLVIEKQTLNLFEQTISLKSVQNSVEYRKLDQQMGDIVKLLDDFSIRKAWDINLFYRKLYLNHVMGWIQSLAEARAKEAENISLLLYKLHSIDISGLKKNDHQRVKNILCQIYEAISKIQIEADAVKKPSSDDTTQIDLN